MTDEELWKYMDSQVDTLYASLLDKMLTLHNIQKRWYWRLNPFWISKCQDVYRKIRTIDLNICGKIRYCSNKWYTGREGENNSFWDVPSTTVIWMKLADEFEKKTGSKIKREWVKAPEGVKWDELREWWKKVEES
jgi:hypothetical protein